MGLASDMHGISHLDGCPAVKPWPAFKRDGKHVLVQTGRTCTCPKPKPVASTKCSCGSEDTGWWSFSVVELTEENSIGPRSLTAYLCKGCGAVAFALLAENGFFANTKAYAPPEEIAAKPVVPPPPAPRRRR